MSGTTTTTNNTPSTTSTTATPTTATDTPTTTTTGICRMSQALALAFVSGLFGIWLLTLCTILDLKNLQKRCEGY